MARHDRGREEYLIETSDSDDSVDYFFKEEDSNVTGEEFDSLQPYRFEPYLDDSVTDNSESSGSEVDTNPSHQPISPDIGRLQNTEW